MSLGSQNLVKITIDCVAIFVLFLSLLQIKFFRRKILETRKNNLLYILLTPPLKLHVIHSYNIIFYLLEVKRFLICLYK